MVVVVVVVVVGVVVIVVSCELLPVVYTAVLAICDVFSSNCMPFYEILDSNISGVCGGAWGGGLAPSNVGAHAL